MSSLWYAVRLIWAADRRGLLITAGSQLGAAVTLVVLVLACRSVLDAAMTVRGGAGTVGGGVLPVIAVAVTLGSASGVLRIIGAARQRVLAVRLDRHIIDMVLHSVSQAELADFETPQFQDRVQRAVFASRSQPAMVVTALIASFQAVVTVGVVMAVLAALVWWLLPVAVIGAVPVLRAAGHERRAGYGLSRELAETRRIRQYFERLLTGWQEAKELRALRLAGLIRERWRRQYGREIDDTVALYRRHAVRKALARLTGDLLTITVIGMVWWQVSIGRVGVSTAVAVLVALWQMSIRMQVVGAMLTGIGESVLYLNDLRYFDRGGAQPAGGEARARDRFAGVAADRVSFRYPGATRDALRDVDIAVRPGEVVALVGANGSGKTTLAKILAGLYRPDSGQLRHGDRILDDPAELRDHTAVVFQDFARYRLSALDNIAFGRPEQPVCEDRARWAAQKVGLLDAVRRMPEGWHSPLSREFTGGAELSGGQWQRLALARAFYRDAPFVILDEPTAALDPDAEAELFAQVRQLFAGRSVLLVSHRFSGVRDADRIIVLDQGRVIENGTHQALMGLSGAYARMFALQADAYQRAEPLVRTPA